MNFEKELRKLKKERKRRDKLGWEDYDWCSQEGNIVEGKINLLEEIIGETK